MLPRTHTNPGRLSFLLLAFAAAPLALAQPAASACDT